MMRRLQFAGLLAFALTGLPACDSADADDSADGGETSEADTTGGASVDEATVQAKLDAFPTGFTKINDASVETQAHTTAELVDVWVEDAWVEQFSTIDPAASGSAPSFGEGATIVKEQFNGQGELDSMTVMVKAGAGFNSDVGDWWWAFADGSAQLQSAGIIDACIGCHQARPDDDFLYGIPLDNRL